MIALFTFSLSYSQKLHFKVVNAESLEGLLQAKITCSLHKDSIIFTNQTGDFSLNYFKGDTITISKNNFHTIHLYLPQINVDTLHIITVGMVAGNENNLNVKNIAGLPMFEYYFVHKKEEQNNVKVQVFENPYVVEQRQNGSFKIASIHLNDFHRQQQKK